jgi:UDP-glucose 4-epimerase
VSRPKVCVTGAAGFIGSHVVEALAPTCDVVGIDDLSTGRKENLLGLDCTLVEGSILDPDALAEATAGAQAIVHLAARPSVPRSLADPVASHEANATGTLMVLEAARRVGDPLVVVASSSSVYGANPELPKHEGLVPQPMSPYAVGKLAGEHYCLAWQHSFGLRTLALRFFNVFGPRQAPGHAYAAVVPSFLYAALRHQPVTVHGDGTQSRDFTYVGTVAQVIATAVHQQVRHEQPVNLAFGTRTSLLELLDLVEHVVEHEVQRVHTDARVGDVLHSQACNARLMGLFPDVQPVALADGLAATAQWLKGEL